jgi:hypothetical protein
MLDIVPHLTDVMVKASIRRHSTFALDVERKSFHLPCLAVLMQAIDQHGEQHKKSKPVRNHRYGFVQIAFLS